MVACSKMSYVLKLYVYEGAPRYDKSSGFGQGYVIVRLMKMADIYNCGYHLFTDNLFTTYSVSDFLLHKRTFINGTMHHNQLKHLTKEIVSATPRVGEKIYYRKNNFLAMSYKQKKSQTKPVIMLSTFVGAYDVAHHKDVSKSVSAIADSSSKHMGGNDRSDQILYAYLDERKSLQWRKKVIFKLLMQLVMNSYILCKLNMQKALNQQDYLVQIIDSLASEYKNITFKRQNSQQTSSGIETLPGEKEKDYCVCPNCKKQKLGININERFVLNMTKAYMVLA